MVRKLLIPCPVPSDEGKQTRKIILDTICLIRYSEGFACKVFESGDDREVSDKTEPPAYVVVQLRENGNYEISFPANWFAVSHIAFRLKTVQGHDIGHVVVQDPKTKLKVKE